MPSKQGGGSGIRIPPKDVVKFIIREALKDGKVKSQKELADTVMRKLGKADENYRITGRRARIIALEIPAKIRIETRHGAMPKRCPSCGHSMKKSHTKNLYGKNIVTGLRCGRCGFRGSEGRWVPKRYYFSL